MTTIKQEQIRNIGIIAHIDAGKTTVTERFLYYTGKTHRMGDVDEGNTVTDWMPQEQRRGITITAAVVDYPWKEYIIHLIDTPGHVDFTIEVERSLRVLDGAVVVLDAVEGVEAQTETVWRQANHYKVPRIVFINKMDRMGADFERSLQTIIDQLSARPLPIQIPWGSEHEFCGAFDLIENVALYWSGEQFGSVFETVPIPPEYLDQVAQAREQMIEIIADFDDHIAEQYLEGHEISADELRSAIRRLTISNQLVPVLCGSALRYKGIQPLLDAIGLYLPSPIDLPPVQGIHPDTGEIIERKPSDDEPLCLLVFKIMMDEGRRLTYFRVYSGVLHVKDNLWNATRKINDRVARLFLLHGGKKERTESLSAGFLGAARGLKDSMTGDTLCSNEHPILLEKINTMEPVIVLAVEPESNRDREELDKALKKLAEEDPTFRAKEDEDTGQILLSGMGELHLDVLCTRLIEEFHTNIRVGQPQVVYRETIGESARAEITFQRDTDEGRLFAAVALSIAPRERSSGNLIIEAIENSTEIPHIALQAVREAIGDVFESGVSAGYPLVDIQVTINKMTTSAEGHASYSAWKASTTQALHQAVTQAKPKLLEPLMSVIVLVPNEYTGEVIGDLNSRHAEIRAVEPQDLRTEINAIVPLKQMFGYSTQLRGISQGRGIFTMQFRAFGSQ